MYWDEFPDWAKEHILNMLNAIKIFDHDTFEHCVRVGLNSSLLAQAAGLSEYDQKIMEYAGLFHDVGKALIPHDILIKPDKLTQQEYHRMKEHPVESEKMMTPLSSEVFFTNVAPGVRHHHERIDGKGYPDGLTGDQIPLSARIILIADTYDAMTQDRAYRKGLPSEVAYAELKKFSGQQFDAHLVKIFLEAQPHFEKPHGMIHNEDVRHYKKVKAAS